jgi:hypothetical protein
VTGGTVEALPQRGQPTAGEVGLTAVAEPSAGATDIVVHAMDQHITGDLTADSGACIGCVSGSAAGTGQVIARSTNPNFYLDDTNASNADFQIEVWGGMFDIFDTDNTAYPLEIEDDSPHASLHVDSSGYIGFSTTTPAAELHVIGDGGNALLRLQEPGGAYGLWFAGSAYTGFGLDGGGGYSEPLKINYGAPSNSLYIASSGKVGIGTASPYYDLDAPSAYMRVGGGVYVGANAGTYTLDFLGNTGADRNIFRSGVSGYSNGFTVRYQNSPQAMVYAFINGNVGIGTATPTYPLHMSSGAHVTAGGVWTNASSRSFKQNIESLDGDEAAATLANLDPVKFEYKSDPSERHVGFIAEDVPALLATGDRTGLSPMDIVAVLTKVVQEQQKTISELKARLEKLESW